MSFKSFFKTIHEAAWGPNASGNTGNVSMVARSAQSKSISSTQCYEVSIAVNKAVSAITRNLAKAKIRLFTRDGAEVTGGPLFNLMQRPAPDLSQGQWITEVMSWWNIAGEMVFRIMHGGITAPVLGLFPLDPYQLKITRPIRPKSRMFVEEWRYVWGDDYEDDILTNADIGFARMFNPSDRVRGLSPLVSGTLSASTNYFAERYNKSFFENYCTPSHIINLKENTTREQKQDFKEQWKENFSVFGNNAHKFMMVAGTEVKVEKLDAAFQDGQFMELMRYNDEKIAMLYNVPAIEMGIIAASKFDSADAERELFAEATLQPQMAVLSDVIQNQVIDRYYPKASISTTQVKMSKALTNEFDKARVERPGSNVIALLDPDTLPIMAKLRLNAIAAAKALREDMMYSPKEAADFMGIDLPDASDPKNEELRNDIWIPAKVINVTKPEVNPQWGQDPKGGEPREQGQEVKPKPKPKKKLSDDDKQKVKSLRSFYSEFREMILKQVAENKNFSLSGAYQLLQKHKIDRTSKVSRRIAKDYLNIRAILQQNLCAEDGQRAAKDTLNFSMSRRSLRSLIS